MPSKENQQKFVVILRNFLVFLSLFLVVSVSAKADNAYLVEGVAVDASAESSGEAKNIATADARRNAFVSLLSRLSLNTEIADNIIDENISDMVRSEQITQEKIYSGGYSAKFNILFSKREVERILDIQRNLAREEKYLLLPVKVVSRKTIKANAYPSKYLVWDEENDWRESIENILSRRSSSKFIIPENDFNNIAVLNHDNVGNVEYHDLEPLLNRYSAKEAFLIFFVYDDIANKVNISVQNIKKLHKKKTRLSFVNVKFLKYESLLKKVAAKTLKYIIKTKSRKAVKPETSLIKMEIPISSLKDWKKAKEKIEKSHLISQMNIDSISKDFAVISVVYDDVQVDIEKAFAKANFSLKRKSENFYKLSF